MNVQSKFIKNVLTLMTGAGLAQIIPVAMSPILTRLFSPEEFGILGFYLSIVSVLSILATGRYELAIMLPKRLRSSIQLMYLSILLAVLTCIFSYILIVMFYENIVGTMELKGIDKWVWLIPLGVLFTSSLQSFNYFYNKFDRYKLIATNKVFQSLVTATANITIAVWGSVSFGLIIGSLLGLLFSFFNYLYAWKYAEYGVKPSAREMRVLARKYKDFTKYGVFSGVCNNLSSNSPVIMFSILFNGSVAGFFSLANRILMLPMNIIGGAVTQAFLKEITDHKDDLGFIQKITVSTLRKLFYLGFAPMLILAIWGEYLFAFIFGNEWREAGLYAQYMVPLIYLVFVTSPISSLLISLEKQRESLVFNFFILIFRVLALYLGWYTFNDPQLSLSFYVIISFVIWFALLYYIFRLLGKSMFFIIKDIFVFIFTYLTIYYLQRVITYGI